MKKIALMLVCSLLCTVNLLAQRDLIYSGGNCVSSMVCDNGNVFVWGKNSTTTSTGLLGVGSTAAKVYVPTIVPYFKTHGVQIRQVNSGSGSHFIALDCNGNVYCWGNNSLGQCGNLTSVTKTEGKIQNEPARVLIGSNTPTSATKGLSGTEYSDGGYLRNVDVVYAGNNSSFAILGGSSYKGCLVAWGGNEVGFDGQGYDNCYGQLGCGNMVNQANPVFVLDGKTKQPLQGVVQVFAGDNSAYALVDPDGDGFGTVYSWGYQKGNGSLGRAKNGGSNDAAPGGATSGADIQDPYAYPVCFANGTPLSNITMLGCGDGAGYGLDADGYIWSWGNGSWNNSAGYMDAASGWLGTSSLPLRVRAGITTGASNDGTYLLAKYVSGGQGFGMAITVDNKPVAWGGDSPTNGGLTGNGLSKEAQPDTDPHYIQYAAGAVHDDVVLINRGDTWGFYGRGDGSVWAWGNNADGQAGLGSALATALYAKEVTLDPDCAPHDQDAKLDLSEGDMTVCASSFKGLTLDAGFLLKDVKLMPKYTITWYKDGAVVKEGTIDQVGLSYDVTEVGKYNVKLEHTGSDEGCYEYIPALDSMEITAFEQTYTIPALTFCGDSATVKVNAQNARAEYSWYASSGTNAVALDTTVGSAATKISVKGISKNADGTKSIYVEETAGGGGSFIPSTFTAFTASQQAGQQNNFSNPGFTVTSPITLKDFKMKVEGAMVSHYVNGTELLEGAINFGVNLCRSKIDNKNVVADKTSIVKAFTGTYAMSKEITATGTYTFPGVLTINAGDIVLQPGTYFLVYAGVTQTGNADANSAKVYYGAKGLVGVGDTYDGKTVVGIGAAQDNNFKTDQTGAFYDINFATPQGFCDRIKIDLPEDCPCNKPVAVTIAGSDADNVLCPGGVSTLTPTAQTTDKFTYEWYKGTELLDSKASTQLTYDATEAGTYIVKVYDTENPTTTSCQTTAEITIEESEYPSVTLAGGKTYCVADIKDPIVLTITGEPSFTLDYSITTSTTLGDDVQTKTETLTATTLSLPVPEEDIARKTTYIYEVTGLSDKYCTAPAANLGIAQEVIVKLSPKITASNNSGTGVCAGTSVKLTGTSNAAGTFVWTDASNTVLSTSTTDKTFTLTGTTSATTGTYTFTVTTADGCVSTATTDVTVFDIPNAPTITQPTAICDGADLQIKATAPTNVVGATYTYEWTGPNSYEGTDLNVTITDATTAATGTYSVTATANGCTSEAATIDAVVNPIPDAPQAGNPTYCVTMSADDVKLLSDAITSKSSDPTTVLSWYDASKTKLASVPKPSIATSGSTNYYVLQTVLGCSSDYTLITVTVKDKLEPKIVLSKDAVCAGTSVDVSLGQAFEKTTWSGTAAPYLTATTTAPTTFKGDAPASATEYTIVVDVESDGCTGTASETIKVNFVPTAVLTVDDNQHCITETAAQTITATITPATLTGTGTWTGATKATEKTATFVPSDHTAGSYPVTYDFVSADNCPAKQVDTVMLVDALPNPSITVSNDDVCVSGNNSDAVTITTIGTVPTGNFAYTINNSGKINANTGEFKPTENTDGTYTITLTYTDGNGCVKTATDEVTVNKLPEVTLSNPSEICYKGAAITIAATVSPTGGNGVWTGTASASNPSFDPKTVAVGTSNFKYEYTDLHKCVNSANSTIQVVDVQKPIVDAIYQPKVVIVNGGALSDDTDLNATAATAGDVLQWKQKTPSEGTYANGVNKFETGLTAASPEGSYGYLVREYKMVEGKACYSDSTIATLVISNCESKPPVANDIYICLGDDIATQELTSTRTATPSVTDYKIAWLSIDPVGKLGTAADASILAAAASYTPSVDVTAVGDYNYYVAEFDNAKQCWSAGKMVTLHVVDTPSVTITSPADICAIGTEPVAVTVNPKTGNLTASAGTIDGFNWLPGNYTGDNSAVTFTYEVSSSAYADGTVCKSTVTSNTTAHFMEAPTGSNNIWLIGDIDNIPDLQGTLTSTGQTMNWYKEQGVSTKINTGTSYETDKAALKTATAGLDSYKVSYWITQTDNYTCESEPSEVTLNLVDCPWEAPGVTNIEQCHGTDLADLVATEGASVATMAQGGAVSDWIWYDANNTEITGANASTYAHTVSNTADVTTTFYVAYSAVEKSSKQECTSPKSKVTVTVLPLPTISFEKATETVCYTQSEVVVKANASSENGTGTATWKITGDASAISSDGVFYPQKNGKIEGQESYTITYIYEDQKACVDSAKRTIDVVYLSAPETEGFFAMTSQTNPVEVQVTSALTTGASAKWFATNTSTSTEAGSGATWATSDPTSVAIPSGKTYYARQQKGACFSDPTPAIVTIVDCPIPTVIINNDKACNYEEIPTLKATTGSWTGRDALLSEFKFYTTQTGGSALSSSQSGEWQPTNISSSGGLLKTGTNEYYVSEYNSTPLANLTNPEGCESPRTKVIVEIKATAAPIVTALSDVEVCAETPNPRFTAENLVGTVQWFEENPGEYGAPTVSAKGATTTFQPTGTAPSPSYTIWAVQLAGGCYSPRTSATYTINAIPNPPTTVGASICDKQPAVSVTATGEAGAEIWWYSDNAKSKVLASESNGYRSAEIIPGTYTYYATQWVNNCESMPAAAEYRIKSLPSAPLIQGQKDICAYEDALTLTAIGNNITWYASDMTTEIATGNSYLTTDMTGGKKTYYATQTVEDCEGASSKASYTINSKPDAPVVTGASMCEGQVIVPALATSRVDDKWYADQNATTFIAVGSTYTPTTAEVGAGDENGNKTYYVQREIKGCVSDIVPVVLHVVQRPTFAIGEDITKCIYDDVETIQAESFSPAINEASTVNWQIQSGKVVKQYDSEEDYTFTPIADVTAAGDYTISASYKYVYENKYCMSDTISITYSVKERARKPIVFTQIICQGEDIKDLQALGSPNIVWGSLDGTLPVVDYGQRYRFQANQTLEPNTYRFIIYDQNIYDAENNLGCKSEIDTVSMTVAPAAKTKLFGSDSVCVGTVAEQYYTQYTKDSKYFWNVTGDHLNYAKTDATSVRYVDWMEAGIDTLTIYEQTWAGCEGFDTLVVKVAPMPEPKFTWTMPGSSNVIELTDSTVQDSLWYIGAEGDSIAEPVTYTAYWNFGHIGESETAIDTIIPYNQRNRPVLEGGYTFGYNCPVLTVENSFGCSEKYTECIFVKISTSLYIPNAFSPTNPAHSVRSFQPKGFNLKTCEISVYDKWGNLLWYSDEVQDGVFVGSWDGRYDGKMMKSDVYIWKMEATFLDGQSWEGFDAGNGKKTKFGSVTLIR